MKYKSIMQEHLDVCYICGQKPTDWHHVMNGFNKKNSEKYCGMIHICHPCHMALHNNSIRLRQFKQSFQRMFLAEHTQEEWMKAFHKNYL